MNNESYNPDVLSCLANLSNDQVFTPPNVVNEMLDILPKELWSDKNAKFLDETTLKKYEESDFIREKDIVINSTGTGTIGRVGFIIDKEIYQKKVVADSHVTVIRVCDDILSDFIYYYLKSKQKYLELQGTGSTNQKELSPETIKNILVPVPPKDEQISIIHKMEKLLSVIK